MNYSLEELKEFFYFHNQEYTLTQLIKKFNVQPLDIPNFIELLYQLECNGQVYGNSRGNFISTHFPTFTLKCGELQISNRNHAYVNLHDGKKVILTMDDVRIHGGKIGDHVYIETEPTKHPKCMHGKIKKIIGKADVPLLEEFSMEGVVKKNLLKNYYYVLKDNIEIPLTNLNGAFIRDKVMVNVIKSKNGYVARVLKVLSQASDKRVFILDEGVWKAFENPDLKGILTRQEKTYQNGTRILANYTYDEKNNCFYISPIKVIAKTNMDEDVVCLAEEYGFSRDFPEKVIEETNNIYIPNNLYEKRMDLRGIPTFTIDPIYAKDLDDAVSVQKLGGGGYRLYVHIADVSYFIANSPEIVNEALRRGTSCYLSHFVFPMLPQRLSDDLCSLNPGEDKYAKTFEIDIDSNGNAKDYRVYNSIIRSGKKFDYGSVNRFLEEGVLTNEVLPFAQDILTMQELSLLLEKKKKARGALEFETSEMKFEYGAYGNATHVEEEQRGPANKLIENFMLLANESTAKYAQQIGIPFVYRNHSVPSKTALYKLRNTLRTYQAKVRNINSFQQAINMQQYMISLSEGLSEEELKYFAAIFLRSLPRARYDAKSYGHYGLNYKTYATVTSPIRRFADLANHMSLSQYQNYGINSSEMNAISEMINSICDYISERQKIEDELEKDVNYMLLQNYASNYYGEVIEATIEFLGDNKIFARTINNIPGTINLRGAIYINENHSIIYNNQIYRTGDKISIEIIPSKNKMQGIEFLLRERGLERRRRND